MSDFTPCTNVDLAVDVAGCNATEQKVTLELYRISDGQTTVIIEYYDDEGDKKTLELPAGRK